MSRIHHADAVAIRKAGIAGWEPFKYVRIGEGMLITGGIPRIITKGPRKGKKTWAGAGTSVCVTRAEVDAEAARFTSETGKCAECYGDGQVFASWHHIEGTKCRPCKPCGGTGITRKEPA